MQHIKEAGAEVVDARLEGGDLPWVGLLEKVKDLF